MLRAGVASALVVLILASGAECFQDAAQGDAANLEAGKAEKPLPIKYHTADGMHRIDLIDDEADDETYRAFQLARYTGEANMQVRAHEEQFMREREESRRREEEESSTELGEQNDAHANEQQQQQPGGHEALLQVSEGKHESGMKRIMGSDNYALGELGDKNNENNDLGETAKAQTKAEANAEAKAHAQAEAKEEAFEAVHVSQSGDIEDGDAHFVMTDKLRHTELKEAVLSNPEKDQEAIAGKLADQMEKERSAIQAFETKQRHKNSIDEHKMAIDADVAAALKRHHLQKDAKGRLVPDF